MPNDALTRQRKDKNFFMKYIILFISILFFANYNAARAQNSEKNQQLKMNDLCFECGDNVFLKDSCSFYFECDCCSETLIFYNEETFYSFIQCVEKTSVTKGTYSINNDEIEFRYCGVTAYKEEIDTVGIIHSGRNIIYSEEVRDPFILTEKIDKCGDKIILIDKEHKQRCIQLEKQVSGYEIFDDYYIERLDLLEVKYFDLLENLNVYSRDLDDIILKKIDQIEGAKFIYFDDEHSEIVARSNGTAGEGKVIYSPDDKFKIFSFSGEGCGAHCSGSYVAMIQFQSGKLAKIRLAGVNSIIKTGDNMYAIIQTEWDGGTMGSRSKKVKIITLENDTVFFIPFVFESSEIEKSFNYFEEYSRDYIYFSNYWWMPCPLSLDYCAETGKFYYSYGINNYDTEILERIVEKFPESATLKNNEAVCIKGEFTLTNNKISNHSEKYSIISGV